MNVLLTKRINRYLTVIATIAVITACSTPQITTSPADVPPAVFSDLERDSSYYLNKDQQQGSDNNLIWQFLAAQALITEKKFTMADAVIESLRANALTAEQSTMLNLLTADNAYAQNKLPETQAALSATDFQALNDTEVVHYLKLQAAVHIRNELPFEATETMLLLAPRLTLDTEIQEYNDLLLAQLSLLSREHLNQYQPIINDTEIPEELYVEEEVTADDIVEITDVKEVVIEPVLVNTITIDQAFKEGWYALAALYQKSESRPNLLSRQLAEWKVTHPYHDALLFMPLVLTNIETLSPFMPDNIAVVLPLSGRYKKQGKAVQLGLLTAYYDQLKTFSAEQKVNAPKLHFFDTKVGNSAELAQQLAASNIDFVVGPLMKTEIDSLLPLLADTPVLALNRLAEKTQVLDSEVVDEVGDDLITEGIAESGNKFADEFVAEEEQAAALDVQTEVFTEAQIPWHFGFPLSPENEARQAAQKILSDGHKKPLIIAPNSDYGIRVANAFATQWAQLTTESDVQVEAYYFDSKAKFAKFIGNVLHTDASKSRIYQMKVMTNLPLETEVRSRRDTDAIYIVSKRDELILLKPFIDVSVSPFAARIPLYSSSRSHSLDRNNIQNKELTGLTFSDNHFLVDPESTLSQEVENAWDKQPFTTLRLFSLGYDSYQLIEQLIYLQNNNDAVYKGLIGDLRLGADNSIQAKLSWAQYQDGKLIEITTPIAAE